MATMHRQVRGSTAKANTLPFRHSIIAPTCYIRQQRQRPMYASSSPFAGTTCNSGEVHLGHHISRPHVRAEQRRIGVRGIAVYVICS